MHLNHFGVGDFVLINLFGSEKLVGQIIDVAIYRDVPQAKRNAVVDNGGHTFLLSLWPFVGENDDEHH